MKIQNKELTEDNYLDKVTYVPQYLNGDASKGEQGVIIRWNDDTNIVFVLYSKGRTVQGTNPIDLVWG
jgi:hypothetical protein